MSCDSAVSNEPEMPVINNEMLNADSTEDD